MSEKKIAFLIQAYADDRALKRLADTLLKNCNCEIFIHLDRKSDLEKFRIDNEKVHFIEERELVSWAGYYQGKLIFNLISAALRWPEKFDMYCFLSESDYPVMAGDRLYERLENARTILLDCTEKMTEKVSRYWCYDFHIRSAKINKYVSKIVNGVLGAAYKLQLLRKKPTVLLDGKPCTVYCSGPFWVYAYEQMKYLDEVFRRNQKMQRYFRHSFAPCELMVSTIIGNSPYRDSCVLAEEYINLNHISDLCYFKYTGPRVNVLDDSDWQDIQDSGKPFIRKVSDEKSGKLFSLIEENLKA